MYEENSLCSFIEYMSRICRDRCDAVMLRCDDVTLSCDAVMLRCDDVMLSCEDVMLSCDGVKFIYTYLDVYIIYIQYIHIYT